MRKSSKARPRRSSRAASVPLAELDCFMCEGTGRRYSENVYGEAAGQEAKFRQSCGVRIVLQIRREAASPRKENIRGGSGELEKSDSKPPKRDFSFFMEEGNEGRVLNPRFETRSTYIVPVGRIFAAQPATASCR